VRKTIGTERRGEIGLEEIGMEEKRKRNGKEARELRQLSTLRNCFFRK